VWTCVCVQISVSEGCKRLSFVVLSWNELALSFYRKLMKAVDKTETENWHMLLVGEAHLKQLATNPPLCTACSN